MCAVTAVQVAFVSPVCGPSVPNVGLKRSTFMLTHTAFGLRCRWWFLQRLRCHQVMPLQRVSATDGSGECLARCEPRCTSVFYWWQVSDCPYPVRV